MKKYFKYIKPFLMFIVVFFLVFLLLLVGVLSVNAAEPSTENTTNIEETSGLEDEISSLPESEPESESSDSEGETVDLPEELSEEDPANIVIVSLPADEVTYYDSIEEYLISDENAGYVDYYQYQMIGTVKNILILSCIQTAFVFLCFIGIWRSK